VQLARLVLGMNGLHVASSKVGSTASGTTSVRAM
jgi:hypothetical protein